MTVKRTSDVPSHAKPVGWQELLNPAISRRSLLGGLVAAPTLTYAELSQASTKVWFDLEFTLSDDLRSLTVLEIEVSPGEITNNRRVAARWVIPSAAFGPDAFFDMSQPDQEPIGPTTAPLRIVYVRNIAYGLRFDTISKGRGFVAFKFERPSVRWTISYITNLWLLSNGKTDAVESSRSAYFHAFTNTPTLDDESAQQLGRLLPFEDIAHGRISSTLSSIFANQVAAPAKQGDFRVTIDQHLIWTVIGRNGLTVQSLGGRVKASTFSFGWLESKKDGASDADRGGKNTVKPASYFAGFAGPDALQLSHSSGILELGVGHRISVKPADVCTMRLDVIAGSAPFLSSQKQVVSALTIGDGALAVHETDRLLTDGVSARGLVLSQTTTPGAPDAQRRSVLWGMSTGTGPAIFRSGLKEKRWHMPGEIISPVGRLRIGRPETQAAGNDVDDRQAAALETATPALQLDIREAHRGSCAPLGPEDKSSEQLARLFQIANGDRAGAPDATLFALHDRPLKNSSETGTLKRIHIDVALFATDYALPDTSFSRLSFRGSSLRLQYEDGKPISHLGNGEYPRPIASSFVWLGNLAGEARRASFDLSTATLTAARDYDLVKLRFKFQDLLLEHRAKPEIRPAHEDARISVQPDGTVHDTRPILVAEFDPQHVLEEAIFRPELPGLPDVDISDVAGIPDEMKNQAAIIEALEKEPDIGKRKDFRAKIRAEKVKKEGGDGPFDKLAKAYATVSSSMPGDQQDYIGPFALDPDGMALARAQMRTSSIEPVAAEIEAMIKRIEAHAASGSRLRTDNRLFQVDDDNVSPDINLANALRNEAVFEALEPLYGVFRSFWRDWVVEYLALKRANATDDKIKNELGFLPPSGANPVDHPALVEYLSLDNRVPGYPTDDNVKALRAKIVGRFVDFALGKEEPPNVVGARLAGRSRLAFRIDCEPPVGVTAPEGGIRETSGDSPDNTGPGNTLYVPIPFTFEGLTDWSRFEAAVTRRARKLFDTLPSGILPRPGSRASNPSDHAMLRFQGFSEGTVTGDARMAEVRASLKSARLANPEAKQGKAFAGEPLDFETSIELPARLFLSTAQDAIWRTNRRVPTILTQSKDGKPIEIGTADPAGLTLEEGETPAGNLFHSPLPWDLWSVRLETSVTTPPSLRFVGSPDLRPDALIASRPVGKMRLPGQGAPPRGPYAPWFIGPEQMESGTLSPKQVADAAKAAGQGDGTETEACLEPPPAKVRYRLIEWLCGRDRFNKSLQPENYALFRTSLDAFDRHQLVLLSSTYGLPVIGKRKPAAPDDVDDARGGLIANSGQIEPGESFEILDAKNGQAIHKPVSLNVQALTLSALGGSLLHDTAFNPSAGADDFLGNKIFEGFSIESLQQDIVLGRDVRTEVVYKGYLLPLGHKASFVKLTERIFLRTPRQGIKAMLRQRMYLRMAERQKLYGAMGQPHGGRMWCGKIVRLLADKTPDIIDPTFPIDGIPTKDHTESVNGRIFLGDGPGLAFWPRTDITDEGFYRFEITIDGTPTALPMIFVDNIAATTAESLQAAVAHYNQALHDKHRTLAIGGLKIDYAPNSKSGEAQFETQTIHIRAHGRTRSASSDKWEGQLEELPNFQTTPVLEGAGQPPFYPMLQKAVIRLGQVEKLSGGNPTPVEVQYDGHYVLNGFPRPVSDGEEPKPVLPTDNPKEIFLNLRNPVSLEMGGNGDRSGGVARPNSHLIAISRKFGPLGGDISTRWDRTRTIELPGSDDVLPAGDGKPNFGKVVDDFNHGRLVSLAAYFNNVVKRQPVARPEPAEDADAAEPFDFDSKKLTDAVKQVQSFFSLDAKLLGTIRLKDLMALMGITPDDIPILKEVYEFGTSALRESENQLNGLANDVRTRVLAPLRDVIKQLRHTWAALDEELKKKQAALLPASGGSGSKTLKPMSLADIYPEIDGGLNKVETALNDALATEDSIALVPKLAQIHTAARELIHGIAIVASNPVERLEQSFIGKINDLVDMLNQLVPLVATLETLRAQLSGADPATLANNVTTWLFNAGGKPEEAAAQIAAILPMEMQILKLEQVLVTQDANAHSIWPNLWKLVAGNSGDGIAHDLISAVQLSIGKATRAAVTAALEALFDGDSVDEARRAGVKELLTIIGGDLDTAILDAKTKLEAFAKAAADEAERQAADLLVLALESFLARIKAQNAEQIAAFASGLEWGALAVWQARAVADAVASGKPEAILMAGGDFAKSVLGVDTDDIKAKFENEISAKVMKNLEPAAAILRGGVLEIKKPAALLLEAEACAALHGEPPQPLMPPDPSSSEAVKALAEVIRSLVAIKAEMQKLVATGGPLKDPALSLPALAALKKEADDLHKQASDLVYAGTPNLIGSFSELYCDLVKLQIAVRDWRPPTNLEKAGLESIGALAGDLQALGRSIAEHLKTIVDLLEAFFRSHGTTGAALAIVATKLAPVLPAHAATFNSLQAAAVASEQQIIDAVWSMAGLGLNLVTTTAAGASDKIQPIIDAIPALDNLADALTLTLTPETTKLKDALIAIKKHMDDLGSIELPGTKPASIRALLDLSPFNGKSFLEFFSKADAGAFADLTKSLRDLEDRARKEVVALLRRLEGAPALLREAVMDYAVKTSDFVGKAGLGYASLKTIRDEALTTAAENPIFAPFVRKLLLVAPIDGLADASPSCPIEDPEKELTDLVKCDRLAQEVSVFEDWAKAASLTTEARAILGRRIVVLFTGWTKGSAAPLLIATQALDMAKDVLRGDVLAALDLGSFRDQIEDAIAALIPTKAKFSYDFKSRIAEVPNEQAIFQPKQGAEFGIAVRASVDLLSHKTDFAATAHIGPFDIYLIGNIAKALRLKFDGAAFSMGQDTSPRFDVKYLDFEIGEDLKFAQKLQSFLTPKEGNGIFIQPMTRGVGIEAGYGINLGTIGVGATSFFNVSLNVSAELPFDNQESLFKVSLGRRLSPFTMGVFPFVGSGYFSIYAAADGVRGFEASFEYGGGAAIGYGPLEASVRISAGVFIRILKTKVKENGKEVMRRKTELYGTFFAGGSASIWIFHFSTSLYVRLGQDAEGAMYGEAIYSFSFSLGFADYKYSITATRKEPKMGSSQASLRQRDGGTRFADGAWIDLTTTGSTSNGGLVVNAKGQSDWDTYSQYFDEELLEGLI